MDNDTIFEFEDRKYLNPQTGLTEQTQFIDTLRDIQAQNTAEINQNTYNLGSQVPSNIGGLTGSEGLWAAQYQTPQTDAQIANLRATAQQEALNQALQNESDIMKNRYKQALRGYYRRQRDKNNTPQNPLGDVGNDPAKTISGKPDDNTVGSIPGQTVTKNEDGYVGTNKAGQVVSRPNWELATISIRELQNSGYDVGAVEKVNDAQVKITYTDTMGNRKSRLFYTDKGYGRPSVDIPGNPSLSGNGGFGW